jgi:probable rRNA maturation factor
MGAFYFLGDIVISTDQTQKQNQKQAHRLKDEYAILAIHGLLHLLGHDHAEPDEKKVMFALQDHLYRKTRHEH